MLQQSVIVAIFSTPQSDTWLPQAKPEPFSSVSLHKTYFTDYSLNSFARYRTERFLTCWYSHFWSNA
jgi:hypothetical protein